MGAAVFRWHRLHRRCDLQNAVRNDSRFRTRNENYAGRHCHVTMPVVVSGGTCKEPAQNEAGSLSWVLRLGRRYSTAGGGLWMNLVAKITQALAAMLSDEDRYQEPDRDSQGSATNYF